MVSGTAILLFKSYMSSRSFSVKASNHASQPLPLSCGVHQGSVLGPLLFILCTTPLSHLIESSSVDHHRYADDTQLQVSFSHQKASFSTSIAQLLFVVNQISQWMSSNLLCLNPSIIRVILFCSLSFGVFLFFFYFVTYLSGNCMTMAILNKLKDFVIQGSPVAGLTSLRVSLL